ncbi:MGH1-like glycoside hydrolase domain-containing protein [Aridibaculum aurantiacum]|uniref:MGH1-like glycoside hydrolase domain-containing protein n=1 Tax=Aridibaculum aurantiacum TaxID=2810307 RepID=UPI001A95635E|nr:glycosyl hydrolase family 65 protein [Aridibaculum aurantiacum]
MNKYILSAAVSLLVAFTSCTSSRPIAQVSGDSILSTNKLKNYVNYFNAVDSEYTFNYVLNKDAYGWLSQNIPLFECPDTTLEKIYYYRWWALRKHLKETPDGFVFTEFITKVNHAGKHNTVSSGLGHHIYEARWLRDPKYVNQYVDFWLHVDPKTPKPHLRAFSSWLQNAIYNLYLVHHNKDFILKNISVLHEDYQQWEKDKQLPNNMFWQYDVRDAMEESISGSRKDKNMRPTINSYMYGNAVAMTKMADALGIDSFKRIYEPKAQLLKKLVHDSLWDSNASFFKVRHPNGKLNDAREAIGFIPWYFNLPYDRKEYAVQWEQIRDTTGFDAPWGLTTAERRHPLFRTHGSGHGCEWDGPVWPYATTQTLKALSNLLTNYKNKNSMTPEVFYDELHTYAWSHQKNGKPYLGEYQDEKTGYWLKGDNPRSSYYNHSSFADLIINDLVGLKPREDNVVELYPLVPEGKWDWFALDNIPYHGRNLSIVYDKNGTKYNKGAGLFIYADGKQIYKGNKLQPVKAKM